MWFQFQSDVENRSQLFYGFPVLPWGPPDVARIAVDAATRQITDPDDRQVNIIDPSDIANTQDFVKERVAGVDSTVPVFNSTCLQTNVFGRLPLASYLQGNP
jgi:sarcosine oxidase/L-pipecolate oxidase